MQWFGRRHLPRRRQTVGRISVRELSEHGLDRHPAAVAIYWPDSQRVVCRDHATSAIALKVTGAVREPSEEAVVLTRKDEAARQLRRQCLACSPPPVPAL
jgi:hypothetical protein